MPDEFLTTREAAAFVRVSLATIRDLVEAGHVRRCTISTGGKLRVRKAELVAHLEQIKFKARAAAEETPEQAARRVCAEESGRRRAHR